MVNNHLTERQTHIARIAILTAISTTDVERLKEVLAEALDFGMSINEINEEVVHLYCYLGFAPSCRTNIVFMNLVNERQKMGITDQRGHAASPIDSSENKYVRGEKLQMLCAGMTSEQLRSGSFGFNPLLDICLKEHLFADLWGRDVIAFSDREIAVVSALAAIGEPFVESHYGGAMNVGVTKEQILEILTLVEKEVSTDVANIARERFEHALTLRNQNKQS